MKDVKGRLKELFREESGQTAVEYMLILAVIVTVIVTLGRTFKSRFNALVENVFNQIDRHVKNL